MKIPLQYDRDLHICLYVQDIRQSKDEWDGSDMCWEWHSIELLKLPYTRHHLAREKEICQEQHGGGQ
jgi:hypothetical protein